MAQFLIPIIICGALMRIKGGGLGHVRRWLEAKAALPEGFFRDALHKILDGGQLSAAGFLLLCVFLGAGWPVAMLGALGWWIGNKPSVGEIIGAIGGYKGTWHEFTGEEGKWWGWKEGLKRGVFTGAMIALGLGHVPFILAGALFPVAVWVGVSVVQFYTGKVASSWFLFEIIWGAALGACFLIWH